MSEHAMKLARAICREIGDGVYNYNNNGDLIIEEPSATDLAALIDETYGPVVEALGNFASLESPANDPKFYESNGGVLGVIERIQRESTAALAKLNKKE